LVSSLKQKVQAEIGKVVVGREAEVELLLVSLLAKGNVLLEGVPGVSKTLLAKAFARCLGLDFRRVQFTPDMLPLDIVGGFVFNMQSREFQFRKGPVFTDILLADEVNRAPPKVQSALLEAMQERQVTVEGQTETLPSHFMVIATQNPLEFQGVYPLPEGQLDRFLMKVVFAYPTKEVEARVLKRNLTDLDVADVGMVLGSGELDQAIGEVDKVLVSDEMLEYLSRLAEATREDNRLDLGVSPRGMVHLVQCARARAFLDEREYVTPDDIKALAPGVLAHRLRLDQKVVLQGTASDVTAVLKEVVDRVKPPR
jgi:MoxR-like ATPase